MVRKTFIFCPFIGYVNSYVLYEFAVKPFAFSPLGSSKIVQNSYLLQQTQVVHKLLNT